MRTKTVLACICLMSCALTGIARAQTLVGCWNFDGNMNDSTGKNNGVFIGGEPTYVAGKLGQAISFDGVDDYVRIPSTTNPSAYSIAVWVRPSLTDAAGIVTRTDAAGPTTDWSHQLRIQNGVFHHYLWVGSERNVPGTTVVSPDTWYHVVIVAMNNGPMQLYVNGEEDAESISTAGTLWAGGDRIHVGSNSGHGMGWFKGLADDLYICNRELTAVQVSGLFNGTTPTFAKAENPNPADGAVGVTTGLLQWTKGEGAAKHDVYLGISPDLTEADRVASGSKNVFYYHVAGLVAGATYYWRVDEIEANGTIHTGDVWTFVAQADAAYYPTPADAANNAQLTSSLTWYAGKGALKHHLYFGGDADAVAGGTAEVDQGLFDAAATTFDAGTLDALTTYYWRVDENKAGNVVLAGPVWSFSTVLPVEDFESYNDDDNRIFDSWLDGYVNGTGATVGNWNSPFAELTIVHDVNQAMPLDYNNVDSPYYSEAEYEFDTAQDWTADDASTLVLYVRGKMGNAAVPLYVGITDSSNKTALVAHPDGAIATRTKWVEWQIPLADFANVSKTRVKKLFIGLGDSKNPTAGGKGRMYIDTICLAK